MIITGYSERGAVNSVFYEIAYSPRADELLNDLVSRVSFPFAERCPPRGEAQVLIEQSFSDFGDADVLLLVDGGPDRRCAVFIEAKVNPLQTKGWSIVEEFKRFQDGLSNKLPSSNLFTQLYQKVRLATTLATDGIKALKKGVVFPPCSTKAIRKIGGNEVVLGAVELLRQSIDEAYFVALVPDSNPDAKLFFDSKLRQPLIPPLDHWDSTKFGYLTWSKVRKFCGLNGLENSLRVLRYNQIGQDGD